MSVLPFVKRSQRGFTLVEIMVSITVLFLGVITAGAVMVTVQRGANFTENRYRDYGELRSRIESLKTQITDNPVQATSLLNSLRKFKTASGHAGTSQFELKAAGFPNLIWVRMTVDQENGAGPIEFTTYLRANDG